MQLQTGVIDFAKLRGRVAVTVDPAITGVNATALYDAIAAVVVGTMDDSFLVDSTLNDTGSKAAASDPFAQRTTKWLVTVQDSTTGAIEQFTIPCADLDQLVAGSHQLDVGAATPGETLVTAIETHGLSKAGNAITVVEIIETSIGGQ
jgi:hypothetical protein